jgi:hypothetical protein
MEISKHSKGTEHKGVTKVLKMRKKYKYDRDVWIA